MRKCVMNWQTVKRDSIEIMNTVIKTASVLLSIKQIIHNPNTLKQLQALRTDTYHGVNKYCEQNIRRNF
jgi:hypothetical protein